MGQLRNQVFYIVLCVALWAAPAMVTSTEPSKRSEHENLPETTVIINNNLGDGLNLNIHCKSKDDDLGTHVIPDGGNYSWHFRVNLGSTTLFFCGFNWQDGSGVFDIYRADRDTERCLHECNWVTRKNGLHGFKQGSREDDILYSWEHHYSDLY